MKPPVRHLMVLRLTPGTHHEGSHGCGSPVIRQSLYDCETGTTVCTVYERIINTLRVGNKVSKTLITYGDVRTDFRYALFVIPAGSDGEVTVTPCLCCSDLHRFDISSRRGKGLYISNKMPHCLLVTLNSHRYAAGPVYHLSLQRVYGGKPEDEGAESHTLHKSTYQYIIPGFH